MKRATLERELYVHENEVSAGDVSQWLTSPAFVNPLRAQMQQLLGRSAAKRILEEILPEGWEELAVVDAALRTTLRLIEQRATTPDRAAQIFQLLLDSTKEGDPRSLIPDKLWTVRPVAAADGEGPKLLVRGAVVLKVNGCW
jgi:hypothetical protein